MALPTPATDIQNALVQVNKNIQSLSESNVDLKGRLAVWRRAFFPLLDKSSVAQSSIHAWIVPTLALEQELGPNPATQEWFVVTNVMTVVNATIAAARENGFVPDAALDAAMTAAFNTAWT